MLPSPLAVSSAAIASGAAVTSEPSLAGLLPAAIGLATTIAQLLAAESSTMMFFEGPSFA